MTSPISKRVLHRYLTAAGYDDNAINSTYYRLGWNKTRWRIEESETPMEGVVDLFAVQSNPTFEMPTQFKKLEWAVDSRGESMRLLSISPTTVLHHAQRAREQKGPETRASVIAGYERLVEAALREMKQDGGQAEQIKALEKIWPKVRAKLVWKKVA